MSWHDIYDALVRLWGNIQFFIAGLLGASVVTRYHSERLKTFQDYAVFIFSGAVTAQYLTQFVIHFFRVDVIHAGGVGFLLGAFGGLIIQELTSWLKTGAYKNTSFITWLADALKSWISRGKK